MPKLAVSRAFRAWPEEACAKFETAITERRVPDWAAAAYMLARYSSQRRGDVLALTWAEIDAAGAVALEQEKTGEAVRVPWRRELVLFLAAHPRRGPFVVASARGREWNRRNFTRAFRAVLDGLGLEGLHLHGLRHTGAREMAEAGATEEEIRAVTGHRSGAAVAIYLRQARRNRLAANAIAKVESVKQPGEV